MSTPSEPRDPNSPSPDDQTIDFTKGETPRESVGPSSLGDLTIPQEGIGFKVGDQFGPFTIRSVLGEGGMGVVYRAQQSHPKRDIALKLIRPGFLTGTLLKRFQLEAEILARLSHPGIAHIYQADVHDSVPYFAMELIEGEPLTQYAHRNKLSSKQRLALFSKICEAVQHAHQKGVIHRDLKPGNILVDQAGQPKILDFGIARATDSDLQLTAVETNIGQLVGTVPYMSPEQAAGDPGDIDTRSDVYALGVILYELLTMRMPYDVSKKLLHEAVRIIREDEPTKLSSISTALRGDIETIVGKSLEKEKDRRYQSANAMSEDIQRYLGNEPIAARPPSFTYQLSKFAARNKALVAGIAAVFLVLIAGIIGTSLALDRALAAEELAGERLVEANTARDAETEAKELATSRANQLEVITEFQSNMLSRIDVEAMGLTLRHEIGAEYRAALVKEGVEAEQIEQRISLFNRDMPWFNPTDAAIALLEKHVLNRSLDTIDEQFTDQPLTQATLQRTLGNTYLAIGRHEAAAQLHLAALDSRRTELGDAHRDTLASMQDLGQAFYRGGDYAKAEPLMVQAHADRVRVLGAEHPDTLESKMRLGMLYTVAGRFDEAEPLLQDSLEARRRLLGEDDPRTHATMENLAILRTEQGRFDDSEQLLSEALDLKRNVYGATHPATLTSLNLLGTLHRIQGQYDKAEPLLIESLAIKRQLLGDEHPQAVNAMVNLGDLYTAQGRFDEAERLYLELLDIKKRILGDQHPLTLDSMNGLGGIYIQQGNTAKAEPLLVETYEIELRTLGPEHPKTLVTMGNLGSLYFGQGKYDRAEPFFVENLAILQRTLGEDHATTMEIKNNVAVVFHKQGRFAEAEPLMVSLLETRRQLLGEDHPKTLDSMNNLGSLYKDQERYTEAEPILSDALKVLRSTLGEKHPNTVVAMVSLAELEQQLDRHIEAEALMAEAVEIAKGIWPEGVWIIAAFQAIHARSLVALQRYDEAQPLLVAGYEVLIKTVGPNHEYTIGAIESSIELYTRLHEIEPDQGHDATAAQWRAKRPATDLEGNENDQ